MNTAQRTVLSINLSEVASDSTKCCGLSIISTLHVHHTVLCAQRSSPRKLTCSLWNVYSDALPECFAGVGEEGVFSLSCFPPLVLACSLLDTEGSKEEKTKMEEGAEIVINYPSQGSI